jgi:hypothetical protein
MPMDKKEKRDRGAIKYPKRLLTLKCPFIISGWWANRSTRRFRTDIKINTLLIAFVLDKVIKLSLSHSRRVGSKDTVNVSRITLYQAIG